MFRFSVPYNNDFSLLEKLVEIKNLNGNRIEEVYLSGPQEFFGSGRVVQRVEIKDIIRIIEFCKENGIKVNLLLNSTCEGKEWYFPQQVTKVLKLIKTLIENGLERVTVANPFYLQKIKKEFEGFYETITLYKKDITKEPIEIVPAAHYMNGGIRVNEFSQSNLEGLYVVGEASCTGVHGANRLASNSLLEAVVFPSRAVEAIVNEAKWKGLRLGKRDLINPSMNLEKHQENVTVVKDTNELKEVMWNNVGIVREEKMLSEAILRIRKTKEKINQQEKNLGKKYLEFVNMLDLSELIAMAALIREESRGCHYRKDFPNENEKWRVTINFVSQQL